MSGWETEDHLPRSRPAVVAAETILPGPKCPVLESRWWGTLSSP